MYHYAELAYFQSHVCSVWLNAEAFHQRLAHHEIHSSGYCGVTNDVCPDVHSFDSRLEA